MSTTVRIRARNPWFLLALAGCHPGRAPEAGSSDARFVPVDVAAVAVDAAGVGGLSSDALMRLYGYADAGRPAVDDGRELGADTQFTGPTGVRVVRVRYEIVLPDERAVVPIERALMLDDQGDRAVAQLVGAGLPVAAGTRVASRAGLGGFTLESATRDRYERASPDDVQRWFLGAASGASTTLDFQRTDGPIVATRGGLSLTLATDRDGPVQPLACRTLVALLLGGDAQAARVGCAMARMPVRATLRSHGWTTLVLTRSSRDEVELPRSALAVPPLDARSGFTPPHDPPTGAFFAPGELAVMPGTHRAGDGLTVTNAMDRTALVFVDDLAVGWVAAGATGVYAGLPSGRHAVRARSLDGIARSRALPEVLPAVVTVGLAPDLR